MLDLFRPEAATRHARLDCTQSENNVCELAGDRAGQRQPHVKNVPSGVDILTLSDCRVSPPFQADRSVEMTGAIFLRNYAPLTHNIYEWAFLSLH